jgi:hypothetical protein
MPQKQHNHYKRIGFVGPNDNRKEPFIGTDEDPRIDAFFFRIKMRFRDIHADIFSVENVQNYSNYGPSF